MKPTSLIRIAFGPGLTLLVVCAIHLSAAYFVPVPNPGAITYLAVVFSAFYGGTAAGLLSAAISLAYAAEYFSIPGELLHFRSEDIARMTTLGVCTPAAAILVGALKARSVRALQNERATRRQVESASQELVSLRAALDQSDVGIVLLDREMRAQFVNRSYRRIWQVPDELADSKPAFVGLLYHARDIRAYALPVSEANAYIAKRIEMVRTGDESPLDLRLADGTVIRFRCKVLSDGGRMLNYGNVSDLVHHADELAELATIDAMTRTYNRSHFLKQMEGEWTRYQRYGRPLSLLLIDIDLFKAVNDAFGHDVGDRVIIFVARMCSEGKRNSDTIARLGGEEFAILLPETDLAEACSVAERLRKSIAAGEVPCGSIAVKVTISIGAATATMKMSSFSELIKQADDMLYTAKRLGRNKLCSEADAETQTLRKVAS